MRVTGNMLVNNLLRNLYYNTRRMEESQNQLASGKRISAPSDDPVGVESSLRLHVNLEENAQYLRNVDDAKAWLGTTDIALNEIGTVLNRALELATQGANGTLPQESQEAIADEIDQLRDHLLQVANSTHGGRYIFGGTETMAAPYGYDTTVTPPVVKANGDPTGAINYEIGVGMTMQINVPGADLFGAGPTGMFGILETLSQRLRQGQSQAISSGSIGDLQGAVDRLLKIRAEVGAKTNQLELAGTRYEDAKINLTSLLSNVEDADIAEVTMDLKMQENVYRASLAVGARIIQPSLIDFLR